MWRGFTIQGTFFKISETAKVNHFDLLTVYLKSKRQIFDFFFSYKFPYAVEVRTACPEQIQGEILSKSALRISRPPEEKKQPRPPASTNEFYVDFF